MRDFNKGGRDRGDRNRGDRGGFNRGGFQQNRGGFNSQRSPRELHKATCTECGQECEVPFKPTPGKSVLCKECFQKNRPAKRY